MFKKSIFQGLSLIIAVFLGYGLGVGSFNHPFLENSLVSNEPKTDLNQLNIASHERKKATVYKKREAFKTTNAKMQKKNPQHSRNNIRSQNRVEQTVRQNEHLYPDVLRENYGEEDPLNEDADSALPVPEQDFFRVEDQFDGEFSQSIWGSKLEQKIDSVFFNMQLNGSQLIEANCRSTLCRLEINHEDTQEESDFLQEVAAFLQNSIQYKAFQRLENPDGTITRVVYLSPEENP